MRIKCLKQNKDYGIIDNGLLLNLKTGLIRKTYISIHGYEMFHMPVAGKSKPMTVHRVVAENFISGDASLDVNHKDGNKLHNHYLNLEFVTKSENTKHAYLIGKMRQGENFWSAKLRDREVKEIRRRYRETNISQRELGKIYRVHQNAIWALLHNKTWKHIK